MTSNLQVSGFIPPPYPSAPRVAVACSGLGHVQRGIEAWARALAQHLHSDGVPVHLFHGGGDYACPNTRLRFARRNASWVRRFARAAPGFTWRWGWKSAYAFEQRSFARALLPHLGHGRFDILHTQDIVVAEQVERARRRGRTDASVLFAHGTNEPPERLASFVHVQHLTPDQEQAARAALGDRVRHHLAPNFIDATPFAQGPSRAAARAQWGLPAEACVVGCAGVLAASVKRTDTLIDEVARLRAHVPDVRLLLAGAWTTETAALERAAAERLGAACVVRRDVPFAAMPAFYRALDLFVLPCAVETFGICLVEAMAAGVPVLAHDTATLRWVVGEGGWTTDVLAPGYLARLWPELAATRAARAAAAPMAAARFTWSAVGATYRNMYAACAAKG